MYGPSLPYLGYKKGTHRFFVRAKKGGKMVSKRISCPGFGLLFRGELTKPTSLQTHYLDIIELDW